MGQVGRYNQAMKPENGEKGHGEEKRVTTGDVFKAVFHRASVPGISGVTPVAGWVCMPKMQLPSRILFVQWELPVCQMSASDLDDGRNGAAQDPYAAAAVVSGVLPGKSGQAGHLSRTTGGTAWDDLQNRLVYAQTHPWCHGAAGREASTQRHH